MMEVKACEIRSQELSACLERLEIATQTYSHPAVFTVQESYAIQEHIPGVHCKTLFLKDQSGEYVLAIAEQDRRIDLKKVAKGLGLKRMSFAKAEEVWELLGVKPGSVTPFALVKREVGTGQSSAGSLSSRSVVAQLPPVDEYPDHNDRDV